MFSRYSRHTFVHDTEVVSQDAKARGIETILALRGGMASDTVTSLETYMSTDPPRGQEHWIPTDLRFAHAVDLVKFIKTTPEFASDFCVGVAGLIPSCSTSGHSTNSLLLQPTLTAIQTKKQMRRGSLSS